MGIAERIGDTGDLATAVSAVLVLIGLIWTMVGGRRWWAERKASREFWRQFRKDWSGEPARDGVTARPGVMARLAEISTDGLHLSERVRKVERDLLKVRSEVTYLLTHRCPSEEGRATTSVAIPEDEEG